MRKILLILGALLLTAAPLLGQAKRLWVLRAPGELVEYDLATFAAKQTVKVPAEALQSPGDLSINRMGQILFAAKLALPLSEEDPRSAHHAWLWNGRSAITMDLGAKREVAQTGSNQAVTEIAPVPFLIAAVQRGRARRVVPMASFG